MFRPWKSDRGPCTLTRGQLRLGENFGWLGKHVRAVGKKMWQGANFPQGYGVAFPWRKFFWSFFCLGMKLQTSEKKPRQDLRDATLGQGFLWRGKKLPPKSPTPITQITIFFYFAALCHKTTGSLGLGVFGGKHACTSPYNSCGLGVIGCNKNHTCLANSGTLEHNLPSNPNREPSRHLIRIPALEEFQIPPGGASIPTRGPWSVGCHSTGPVWSLWSWPFAEPWFLIWGWVSAKPWPRLNASRGRTAARNSTRCTPGRTGTAARTVTNIFSHWDWRWVLILVLNNLAKSKNIKSFGSLQRGEAKKKYLSSNILPCFLGCWCLEVKNHDAANTKSFSKANNFPDTQGGK